MAAVSRGRGPGETTDGGSDVSTALAAAALSAIAVALVNPLAIAAVILLLFSPRAGSAAAFLAGWLAGLVVILGLLLFVIPLDRAMGTEAAPSTLASVIRLLLGLFLLALAVRRWRSRPKVGEVAKSPVWMTALAAAAPPKAAGLGVLMAGLNPKNLAFIVPAAIAIAEAGLATADKVIVLVVFVVLASVGVAVPVIWHAMARERASVTLTGWRDWLTANYGAIMAAIFLLIGVKLVAQGLGGLIG